MLRNSKGFTLIELMIVIVILGVLALVAMPSYFEMRAAAKEGVVKSNMHTVQLAVEDFAADHDGTYPTAADAQAVIALMPGGVSPTNPFTGNPSNIAWGALPAMPGDLGYQITALNQYDITAFGAKEMLGLKLSNY